MFFLFTNVSFWRTLIFFKIEFLMNKELVLYVQKLKQQVESRDFQDALKSIQESQIKFGPFYSLEAEFLFLSLKVYNELKNLQLFFKTTERCFSRNIIKFLPDDFFEIWREMVKKSGEDKWNLFSESLSISDPSESFLGYTAKFKNKFVSALEPVEIHFSFFTYLKKPISGVDIYCDIECSNGDVKRLEVSKNVKLFNSKKEFLVTKYEPNEGTTSVAIKSIVIDVNCQNIIFAVPPQKAKIKPCENDCELIVEQPHVGIIGCPLPVRLIFDSKSAFNYNILFGWEILEENNRIVFSGSEDRQETITALIEVNKPFTRYERMLYLSCSRTISTSLDITWSIFNVPSNQTDEKHSRVNINFKQPFVINSTLLNENKVQIPFTTALTTDVTYIIKLNIDYLLPWKCMIKGLKIVKSDQVDQLNDVIEIGAINCHFPIDLDEGENFSAYFTFSIHENIPKTQLFDIFIEYTIDNKDFSDENGEKQVLSYYEPVQEMSTMSKLIEVAFNFPSQTMQFVETPFSLSFFNKSSVPIEFQFNISDSGDFLIAGVQSVPLSLLPRERMELDFSFYALSHGSLSFPSMFLEAKSNGNKLWESKPSIFVNFSENV